MKPDNDETTVEVNNAKMEERVKNEKIVVWYDRVQQESTGCNKSNRCVYTGAIDEKIKLHV